MKKFKLGHEAKDKVTGFQGILTGYCEYLTGCNQYHIQPKCEKATSYPNGTWIDEGKIELITEEPKLTSKDVKGKKNGCDCMPPNM